MPTLRAPAKFLIVFSVVGAVTTAGYYGYQAFKASSPQPAVEAAAPQPAQAQPQASAAPAPAAAPAEQPQAQPESASNAGLANILGKRK